MMNVDWPEAKSILMEVEQLYCRDDDIGYIQDVKKMAKEIESQYAIYANDTKDIIKSMTRQRYFNNRSWKLSYLFHIIICVVVELTNKIAEKESEILAPSEVRCHRE
jgi:hypothetical protein